VPSTRYGKRNRKPLDSRFQPLLVARSRVRGGERGVPNARKTLAGFDGYRGRLGRGEEREACLRASCSVVILYAK
jgi:hypothetical protein